LFKGAEAIENASKLQTIVFDKTGTLTKGEPSVTDIVTAPINIDPDKKQQMTILRFTAIAEQNSEHLLGESIVRSAQAYSLDLSTPEWFNSIPGHGIDAKIEGVSVLVGNRKLMNERSVDFQAWLPRAEQLEGEGKTVMFVGLDGYAAGLIAVADTLKETSVDAIRRLRQMKLETVMITGDNRRTAEAIAHQVGIDRVLAEVLPQDKAEEVKKLQAQGKRVAMVGDGVNDAPALAQAEVGIAIGSGTDVAKETGDVILIKSDLNDVIVALEIARATMNKVKQNLFWAFIYNTLGIPLAAGLLYPALRLVVSPEVASAFMAISSVSVTLNTLLLKGFKPTTLRKPGQSKPDNTSGSQLTLTTTAGD